MPPFVKREEKPPEPETKSDERKIQSGERERFFDPTRYRLPQIKTSETTPEKSESAEKNRNVSDIRTVVDSSSKRPVDDWKGGARAFEKPRDKEDITSRVDSKDLSDLHPKPEPPVPKEFVREPERPGSSLPNYTGAGFDTLWNRDVKKPDKDAVNESEKAGKSDGVIDHRTEQDDWFDDHDQHIDTPSTDKDAG